jgi:hypothetical protein
MDSRSDFSVMKVFELAGIEFLDGMTAAAKASASTPISPAKALSATPAPDGLRPVPRLLTDTARNREISFRDVTAPHHDAPADTA